MNVRIVISGRNYDKTGALPEGIELPDGASLDEALKQLAERLPERTTLPDSCLIAVSGTHLGTLGRHRPHTLEEDDELVLIAPVAGG